MAELYETHPADAIIGNPYTRDVIMAWEELLESEAKPIYLEGGSPSNSGPDISVGRSREISFQGGQLVLSRYTDHEYQVRIGQRLAQELALPMPITPIGQMEYQKVTPEARVDGSFYFQSPANTSAILATVAVTLEHDTEEVLMEDNEACYEFARSLGAGDLWTKTLLRTARRYEMATMLRDSDKLDLRRTLENLVVNES
jgi:hypothetical protein